MKVSSLIVFFLYFLILPVSAQISRADSIKSLLVFTKDDSQKALLLNDISMEYLYTNSDSAFSYAKRTIALAEKTNNQKALAGGNLSLGITYLLLGNLPESKNSLSSAVNIYTQLINKYEINHTDKTEIIACKKHLAKTYRNYGDVFRATNEFSNALKYNKEALDIQESINDFEGIVSTYSNRGRIYNRLQKPMEAMKCFFKSMEIAEAHDLPAGQAKVNIGNIYYRQQKYDKALEMYNAALKVFKDNKLNQSVCSTLNNIASLYYDLGNIEKALYYNQESLKISISLNNKESMVVSYRDIGDLYLSQKKYSLALEYLDEAQALALEMNDSYLIVPNLLKIGEVFIAQNKNAEAAENINKALSMATKMPDYNFMMEANKLLYKINNATGKYKEALENYINFRIFSDSLYNKETSEKLIRSEMNYEFEKTQAVEKAEKEKKIIELKASLFQKKIITVALITLLILFVLTYLNLRKTSKLNKVIGFQKKELEKVNDELGLSLTQKETLLKEIHHRVKNNLQFISSLLSLQSHGSNNPELISIMKEGKSRIKSMALIHQMLYQNNDFSKLNFQFYLEQLTSELYAGYTNKSNPVVFKIETNNISFDIDTAIPLGLIVSELVTNSLKYAYTNQGGTIMITLEQLADESFKMTVHDSGKGLPADFNLSESQSLGLKLVKMLSQQLRAALEMDSENGARISITFKNRVKL